MCRWGNSWTDRQAQQWAEAAVATFLYSSLFKGEERVIARHEWEGQEYFTEVRVILLTTNRMFFRTIILHACVSQAVHNGEIRGYIQPSPHGAQRPHQNKNETNHAPRLTVTKVLYGQSSPHNTTVQLDINNSGIEREETDSNVEDLWMHFFER